jgi:2-keto-4-pentenoate hydratase/2-oxohepta-3-ene-1,7-dioic acid hydratase in catechol pathway
MRFAAVRANGSIRFGAIDGTRIRLSPTARSVFEVDPDMLTESTSVDPGDLVAPLRSLVRNVYCVGWNYVEHFDEGKGRRGDAAPKENPKLPTFFTKATRSIIGPSEAIQSHSTLTSELDWEVELAVVIGRDGRDITPDEALDYVFGYAVANDVSARNIQRIHGGQWFRGKSLDGTCPIGPAIVTQDEVGVLAPLGIRCRVNGEAVQDARLGDMHFDVPTIIAELSRGLTLLRGDVILTGTPPGVGFSRTPPRFLAVGDVVESEIDLIGTMSNVVTD